MRLPLRSGPLLLAAALLALACTPATPPADPSATDPKEPPPFNLLDYVHLDPPKPAPPPAPPPPPREPVSTAGCPMKWTPAPLHASVTVYPENLVARFMVPFYDAACACSRPGDHLHLAARIVPEIGEIKIVTNSTEEPKVSADPSVDACLATFTSGLKFEPFAPGSDSVCPEPPPEKTQMGPPFFRPPRLAGCSGAPGRTTIVYPLIIDRRDGK